MPRYEYHCSSCEEEMTVEHERGSAPPEECDKCGTHHSLERVYSFNLNKKKTFDKDNAGSQVKSFIEETRQLVKEDKKRMKAKEMK